MNARTTVLLTAMLALSACRATPPAPDRDAPPPLDVTWHMFEVPRIPYPGYHADGVMITRMTGETAWTEAGLRVGDVIESVNDTWTMNPESFWKAVGEGRLRRVRVVESRSGPTFNYRILRIEVA